MKGRPGEQPPAWFIGHRHAPPPQPTLDDTVMQVKTTFRERARFLREASGSTNIERTLLKAVKVLALFKIPHFVCGGFAVQDHGYPRFTQDVDIIVPDVALAREKLSLNGFKANPGSSMTVTDRETKVEVDLLPGGGRVGPSVVGLPMPTEVSATPNVLTLSDLLTAKLSSALGSPVSRAKDYADAVELIKANALPRDYQIDPAVQDAYQRIWDGLEKETRDGTP